MALPNRALYDHELTAFVKQLNIPHFRGVLMRNDLQRRRPWRFESGIVNLDDSRGPGTHWVAYVKRDQHCEYFDSYGNLRPPQEFFNYMSNDVTNISYNYSNIQNYKKYNCGHLCLRFLVNACYDMFGYGV